MHGLINHSIEYFVRDSYGIAAWQDVAARACCNPGGFAPFRDYPDRLTLQLIVASASVLGKPVDELLEDAGAWLARQPVLRRLLRFSGSSYSDFVLSLEELPDRMHLVLPTLEMPRITVSGKGSGRFRVVVTCSPSEWRSVIAGMLRAMSDDYGALALIIDDGAGITVDVSEEAFADAQDFQLAAQSVSPRAALR